MSVHPPTAPGKPGSPAPGTSSPGKLTGLRCPLCEGPVYAPAPGQLTCPACAAEPVPTPDQIAERIGLKHEAGAPSGTPEDEPPAVTPAEAVRRMHARRAALAASPENRMVHDVLDACRELHVKLTAAADALGDDAGQRVLEAAGLDDPDEWTPYGSDAFTHARKEFGTIAEVIGKSLGLAVGEVPPPPPGRVEDSTPIMVNSTITPRGESRVAVEPEFTFENYIAWVRNKNRGFGEALDKAEGRELLVNRLRRQWAYRISSFGKDAYHVATMAGLLHDWMTAFVHNHHGAEGVEALTAAGVPLPRPDEAAEDPADKFADAYQTIEKWLPRVRKLAAALDPMGERPIPNGYLQSEPRGKASR